jgi:NAD+ synthase
MCDDIIKKIVDWLKDTLKDTKAKGYVFGISGGLDSSVCAALIKKATDNSLGLILPIETDVQEIDDASEVASLFNLKTQYIDLTPVYTNLIKFLPDKNRIALGNIKARLRMIIIYYYANLNNYLVCGTGNKTEISLGYFTKFGDGACDVLPLGDLYKCGVRELAKSLGIPEKIIKKVPSAGLWKGQTDEAEIGYSYDEMDKTLRKIEKGKVSGEIGKRLHEMIKNSEHKRKLPKICYIKGN